MNWREGQAVLSFEGTRLMGGDEDAVPAPAVRVCGGIVRVVGSLRASGERAARTALAHRHLLVSLTRRHDVRCPGRGRRVRHHRRRGPAEPTAAVVARHHRARGRAQGLPSAGDSIKTHPLSIGSPTNYFPVTVGASRRQPRPARRPEITVHLGQAGRTDLPQPDQLDQGRAVPVRRAATARPRSGRPVRRGSHHPGHTAHPRLRQPPFRCT